MIFCIFLNKDQQNSPNFACKQYENLQTMTLLRTFLMIFIAVLWIYMLYRLITYYLANSSKKNFSITLDSLTKSSSLMSVLALLSSAGLGYLTFFTNYPKGIINLMWLVHIPWLVLSVFMPLFKKYKISFSGNKIVKTGNAMMSKSLAYDQIDKIVIRRTTVDITAKNKPEPVIELDRQEFKLDMDWLNLVNYLTANFSDKIVDQNPIKKTDIIEEIMKEDEVAETPKTDSHSQSESLEIENPESPQG